LLSVTDVIMNMTAEKPKGFSLQDLFMRSDTKSASARS
jgi:hypothetical protein